ncbi:MAG: box helicase [Hyphomicrobiales bacterium]|nr:box helicase [Hyphomicrobiales bacterium]
MNHKTAPAPLAAIGISLLDACRTARRCQPLIYVAESERRALALHALVAALHPTLRLAFFPAWDTLPYDRLAPSAAIMGARMGVLRWLTNPDAPPQLIVTTAPALLRRLPPREIWPGAHLGFQIGQALDPEAARESLLRLGYVEDDLVDQPGEIALRGRVVDIFPAASPLPCRVLFEDGRITGIRSYDPLSQASEAEAQILDIDPATESIGGDSASSAETILDYAPRSALILEEGAEARAVATFEQIAEGAQARGEKPERLFLAKEEWQALTARHRLTPAFARTPSEPVPAFARMKDAGRAFDRFLASRLEAGDRLVIAGPREGVATLVRRLRRLAPRKIEATADWAAIRTSASGAIFTLAAPLDQGLVLPEEGVTLVAAADLLGSRAGTFASQPVAAPDFIETELHLGDVVVHRDHGLAILERLETVEVPEQGPHDFICLAYADEARQMVPAAEISALWRYGSDAEAVTLDRLDRDTWAKRKEKVAADIAETAKTLVALAAARQTRKAPVIKPAPDLYERFAARFPFAPTQGQAAAIDAVLDDLASGRPMDRLVCGDVGYGKTEVALRAAAAVAFSGRQVALLAPTTVLVRQHLRSFRRRFAGLGIEIAELSRMVEPATARNVKKGLADGSIDIVIGTQALCGKGIAFSDLALVIVDEEQKFGAKNKAQTRALSESAHALTLTATPIPRTLQASLVGLQDLSIIATPPYLRQPVRTAVTQLDARMVRDALMREKRRGGQSFFVCPRVADIAGAAEFLRKTVPELSLLVAHGQMKPAEMDAAMLAFAEGDGDILLATNIIESGLDVPGANTLFVWHAGRFGMAQLHQLRGRVGRGSRRAFVYFLTESGDVKWVAAEKRLRALQALDHLGAGFAISARDLDLRGGGDLMGDDQAGHMKLIGVGLYQEMLSHALAIARGEETRDREPPPDINLGLAARIPEDYVPEPDLRLKLYGEVDALDDTADLTALELTIADRYGPPPDDVTTLLAAARIRLLCRKLGIRRFDAGPSGMAATFAPARLDALSSAIGKTGWKLSEHRLVSPHGSEDPAERLELAESFLEQVSSLLPNGN